ncbi:MAG: hypothetical protein MR487_02985 [Lachnospiraceae bacterium]|nr:hypothetical protein [Lachnospiraceae bacterium]
MYTYSMSEWLLFFYIYCFAGWVFESTYVSICHRKLVNRGFLNGPMIPLYGFGAITVLFAALPFREFPVLVYLVGMIAATLLEYVVGVVMEAIFKVRYWDYSSNKFNLKGYICLSSSIAWGFLSVILIYGIHRPIENFVQRQSFFMVSTSAFLITVLFVADFMASLRTALDIRDTILQAERMKEELNRMRRRIEIIDTFVRADLEERGDALLEKIEGTMENHLGREINLREYIQETILEMTEQVEEVRTRVLSRREEIAHMLASVREERQAAFEKAQMEMESIEQSILEKARSVDEQKPQEDTVPANEQKLMEKFQQMKQHMEELGHIRMDMAVWNDRLCRQFSRDKRSMLHRNPSARYVKSPELLDEIRRDFDAERQEKGKINSHEE